MRRTIIRSSALLLASKIFAQGCSFARNVIVARAIGAENFGIAATFAVTISVMDMIGSLSVDRLLVQASDGDDPNFQSAGHAVQALRGVGTGLIMFILAWPVARLFNVEQAGWAFAYLALVPIFRGFMHLDQQRIQRELDFRLSVAIEILQQLVPTLLAWPIAHATHNYSAMLWLLLIQNAVAMIASFVVARRPYRWHWSVTYLRRFAAFGWPLVVNSVMLFGIYQGDRFLIGSASTTLGITTYSLRDLGIYSVAVSLTLTPMVAVSNISSSLMLPIFSRLQHDPVRLQQKYAACSEALGLASGAFALPLILAGGWIVTTVYGPAYSAGASFVGWLAAAQAIRMARFTPTSAAIAYGDTKNAMVSNLARGSALVVVVAVMLSHAPLPWIAVAAFGGECAGMVVCLWRLRVDHEVPVAPGLKPLALVVVAMGTGGILVPILRTSGPVIRIGAAIGIFIAFATAMLITGSLLRMLFGGKRTPADSQPILLSDAQPGTARN